MHTTQQIHPTDSEYGFDVLKERKNPIRVLISNSKESLKVKPRELQEREGPAYKRWNPFFACLARIFALDQRVRRGKKNRAHRKRICVRI